ncbi:hypothetical protein D3C85_1887800 [compost metagenome]
MPTQSTPVATLTRIAVRRQDSNTSSAECTTSTISGSCATRAKVYMRGLPLRLERAVKLPLCSLRMRLKLGRSA